MQQLPQPVKLYYMGPMFRRERPQKGRYRQFYQIGAEILGGPDAPAIDAELIEMLMTFFDKCGLQGTELSINSIGHAADNCRRGYVAKLKAELEKVKDKLGADSQRRIETNPLRVLDSKLEHEQAIIATLPRIADHLCDDCKAHYAAVKHELELRGVIYRENWRLVRGLDYYMRTTFEITAQGLGLATPSAAAAATTVSSNSSAARPQKASVSPSAKTASFSRSRMQCPSHQSRVTSHRPSTSPGWANAPMPPRSAQRKIYVKRASSSNCPPPN